MHREGRPAALRQPLMAVSGSRLYQMLRQVSNTHTSLGYFHGIQKDQNRSWKPEDTAKPARTRHCWTTSSRPGGREVHFGPKVFSLLLLFILSDFFF